MGGVHASEGLAQRRIGRAGQGRPAQQLGERCCHRSFGRRLRSVGLLQLLARQVEQRAEPALAEVQERRAALRESHEALARQKQAEGVSHRAVRQRHGPLRQQGAYRETVPDTGFEGDALLVRCFALHPPLLDDHAVRRHLAAGSQHDLVRREVADLDALDDEVDVLGRHGRERHVRAEELPESRGDRRCCHAVSSEAAGCRSPAHASVSFCFGGGERCRRRAPRIIHTASTRPTPAIRNSTSIVLSLSAL